MTFEDNLSKINDEIKQHGYILIEESPVQTMKKLRVNVIYKKWCIKDGERLIYYDLICCRNCENWVFRGISPIPRSQMNWLEHCTVHSEMCSKPGILIECSN